MIQKELLFFYIDDDIDDHEIFISALNDISGMNKCVVANTGCEALELMKKNKNYIPDFIFLDLNMPMLGGKECLIELRKIERLKSVPIYIYSTSSNLKDKKETKELGASGFVTKPSSINNLIKIISGIIQLHIK